ncbi:MAG: gliding motility-associated C-terminal domain-containing protein [Prevotella sp.]|nr:gliding motility-associated C-terminal domain-containing protein [Prevotella sp.]
MKKQIRRLMVMAAMLTAIMALPLTVRAQSVNPMAYWTNEDGDDEEGTSIGNGMAPLDVTFRANPENMEGFTPSYEWHFRKMSADGSGESEELFVRYEEDTQYTFTQSGTYNVVLKTMLDQQGTELDSVLIVVAIAESKLEFPNAFSPNGDGINDTYKAKDGYRSIISFRAIIVNRWGQKLYEWNDPAGEWDGTYKGRPVKDGVYFVQVIAKGADGKDYHIRKDVNLLRGYTEGGNNSGTTKE